MHEDEDGPRYLRSDAATADRIDDLLDRMTDAEKAGQLVGTWLGHLDFQSNDLDDVKDAVRDHHLGVAAPFGWAGSPAKRVGDVVDAANELQRVATEETRLGIPLLLNVDAVHGHAYVAGSTVFPNGLGTAATWDPEAVEAAASITATEVRRTGAHQNYSPTCDVGRDPRWGRIFETFGESPRLCAEMAAAKVRGYQGDGLGDPDSVVATAKHFPAYSEPERGEDASPVDVSEYKLRNVFVPPFEAALGAGVESVMPSYNSVNGEPMHGSAYFLTDLLREELGFDGHVVSDWAGVRHLHDDHGTAADHRDGIRQAREAGLDVESVGNVGHAASLTDLIESGDLDADLVDESVRRVLRLKFELGLFEDPYVDEDRARETLASEEHRRTAKAAARDSMTLLKNDGLLPLSGDEDVFVGGPNADDIVHQLGGWSVTEPTDVPGETVLEAIRSRADGTVNYEQGTTLNEELDVDAAVEKAEAADVAVLALGEGWYLHEFGPSVQSGVETGEWPTRSELRLSEAQRELVRRVHATGTPVVGVLITGRPLIVDWMDEHVPAILMAYYPGTEGGAAVAETLFGDNDPSGRLPASIPKSTGDLPQHFDRLAHPTPIGEDEHPDSYDPLYPFGHGLSYAELAYDDLRVSTTGASPNGDAPVVELAVEVTNAGDRPATETVQAYARQETSSRVQPARKLVGFERVELSPDESATVSLSIPAEHFGFYKPRTGRVVESGTYRVRVGNLTGSFEMPDRVE
ncbi:glycoside hydrolase family 3 C-terminal domain-containing protein (plasmid) [Halorussus vallis]|uniref:glycoside hydrolase family 3 N-terminal domain-containing protein n=3 Tax=Halorussus TaxID=1070314 RepID=UPI0020A11D86|nr:glycoside hydrolase family 3 N-terminal domain-containing protein [Halorussus vallis]USZ78367.1 glycoside hydrolase family 3 C-terminal domain-containing protein [Halorussus vallis]